MLAGVDVGMAERAPDDGGRRLVDRQAPGDVGGEAGPQQPVVAGLAVHVRAELDALLTVPQQGLLGDGQPAQLELGHETGTDGAALGPDPRRAGRRAAPGPFGDRCHGPSPQRGWAGYSSWRIISLPGPASSGMPVRLSVTLPSVPPRAGSAVTRNVSFSAETPGISAQPPAGAGPGTAAAR